MGWLEKLGWNANEFVRGLKYGSSLVYKPVKWLSKVGTTLSEKVNDFVQKKAGMVGHEWAKRLADSEIYKDVRALISEAGDFVEKDVPYYANMLDSEILRPGLQYVNEFTGYVPQINPVQMEGLGTRAMDGAPVSANRAVM